MGVTALRWSVPGTTVSLFNDSITMLQRFLYTGGFLSHPGYRKHSGILLQHYDSRLWLTFKQRLKMHLFRRSYLFLAAYRRASGSSPCVCSNGRRPSGAVLHSSREPGVRRPCSDFMDMLWRLINCRFLLLLLLPRSYLLTVPAVCFTAIYIQS